jgi:soluble lytic murein transglycosylase
VSSTTAPTTPRGRPRPSRRRAALRRRRLVAAVVGLLVLAGVVIVGIGSMGDAVRELTLPLRHEDIIRQQANDKRLDPALIAAVIYEESKFSDQTSEAGARGLMQITPDTARYIARKSGGTAFELRDLGTPQVNIAYGSWYLRYLLDRYGGNTELAVAAYNGGESNVDGWIREAGGPSAFSSDDHVQFPETREYVRGVLESRASYRRHYADELGL